MAITAIGPTTQDPSLANMIELTFPTPRQRFFGVLHELKAKALPLNVSLTLDADRIFTLAQGLRAAGLDFHISYNNDGKEVRLNGPLLAKGPQGHEYNLCLYDNRFLGSALTVSSRPLCPPAGIGATPAPVRALLGHAVNLSYTPKALAPH